MKILRLPSRKMLKIWFYYDRMEGALLWRKRPSPRSRRKEFDPAGTLHHSGYIQINFQGRLYLAHRMIWKIMTGREPAAEIDHRNGVRSDNRWPNLRRASSSQNKVNRKTPNFHRGVHWIANRGKFGAQIKAEKKHIWLGSFATPEAACAAYRAKAKKLHGRFGKITCSCR